MTNAELIQKIKAEIERQIALLPTVGYSTQIAGDYIPVRNTLNYLLSFLSTLESEKPMNLDEDFRGEMREWVELMVGASFPEQDGDFISEEDYRSVIKQTAIHFLGINARKEE